jgi:hypothetical protein
MQRFRGTPPAGSTSPELSHSALLRDQRISLGHSLPIRDFAPVSVTVPSVPFMAWAAQLWWQAQDGPFHRVTARGATDDDLPEIDLNDLMPDVSEVSITPSAERSSVSWLDRPFQERDAFAFELSLTALDGVDHMTGFAKWAGLAPPDALAVDLPALPASVFPVPSSGHIRWKVRAFSSARLPDVEGYAQLRGQRLRYAASMGLSNAWPASGVPGRSETSDTYFMPLFDENRAGL